MKCPQCGIEIVNEEEKRIQLLQEQIESIKKDADKKAEEIKKIKQEEIKSKEAEIQSLNKQIITMNRDINKQIDEQVEKQLKYQVQLIQKESSHKIESLNKEIENIKIASENKTVLATESLKKDLDNANKIIAEQDKRMEIERERLRGEVYESLIEQKQKKYVDIPIERLIADNQILQPFPKKLSAGKFLVTLLKEGKEIAYVLIIEKRTKNWSNDWIKEGKDEQIKQKVNATIIVSYTLPSGIETFGCIDNIYISGFDSFIPLMNFISKSILEMANNQSLQALSGSKVVSLLNSPEFKNRMQGFFQYFDKEKERIEKKEKMFIKIIQEDKEQLNYVQNNLLNINNSITLAIQEEPTPPRRNNE